MFSWLPLLFACTDPRPTTRAPAALPVQEIDPVRWAPPASAPDDPLHWSFDHWRLNLGTRDKVLGWTEAGLVIQRNEQPAPRRPGEARLEWIDVATGRVVAERATWGQVLLDPSGTLAIARSGQGFTPVHLDQPGEEDDPWMLDYVQEVLAVDEDGSVQVSTTRCTWATVPPDGEVPAFVRDREPCPFRTARFASRGGRVLLETGREGKARWIGADGRSVDLPSRALAGAEVHGDTVATLRGGQVGLTDMRSGEHQVLRARYDDRSVRLAWSSDGQLAVVDHQRADVWDGDKRVASWVFERPGIRRSSDVAWSPDGERLLVWSGPLPTLLEVATESVLKRDERSFAITAHLGRLAVVEDVEGTGVLDLRADQIAHYGDHARPVHFGENGIELEGSKGRMWVTEGDASLVAPPDSLWAWLGEDQLVAFRKQTDEGWAIDPDSGRVIGTVHRPAGPDCVPTRSVWDFGLGLPARGVTGSCPPPALRNAPTVVAVDPSWTRAFTSPAGVARLDGNGVRIQTFDEVRGMWTGALWSEDGHRVLGWQDRAGQAVLWEADSGVRLGQWSFEVQRHGITQAVALDRAGEVVVLGNAVHDLRGERACDLSPRSTERALLLGPRGDRLLLAGRLDVSMVDLHRCERLWTTGRTLDARAHPSEQWVPQFPPRAP